MLVDVLRRHRRDEPYKGDLVFPNDRGELYTKNGKLEDVLRAAASAGSDSGLVDQRIYIGGWETYRRVQAGALLLERQTLHVLDGERRVAMVERYAHLKPELFGAADRATMKVSLSPGAEVQKLGNDPVDEQEATG